MGLSEPGGAGRCSGSGRCRSEVAVRRVWPGCEKVSSSCRTKTRNKKVTRLSSIISDASATREEPSTTRSSFSSARSQMSRRPAGFAFAGRKAWPQDQEGLPGTVSLSFRLLSHLDQRDAKGFGVDPNVRDTDDDRFPIHWVAARLHQDHRGAHRRWREPVCSGCLPTPATLASEAEQPVRNLLQYGPGPTRRRSTMAWTAHRSTSRSTSPQCSRHRSPGALPTSTIGTTTGRRCTGLRHEGECAAPSSCSQAGAELDRKDALGRTPKALAYDFNQREVYDFRASRGPNGRVRSSPRSRGIISAMHVNFSTPLPAFQRRPL